MNWINKMQEVDIVPNIIGINNSTLMTFVIMNTILVKKILYLN